MAYENLLIERRDVVAIVTVNRPDKLNALNDRTIDELDAAFRSLAEDPEVRGVILTGAGDKAFVAGADIGELSGLGATQGKEFAFQGQTTFTRIASTVVSAKRAEARASQRPSRSGPSRPSSR